MRFFVYDLIDPRTDKTFYVGKGQDDRPYQHERDAIRGRQSPKCALIREILESGNKVKVKIVKRFALEEDAYEAEAERIADFGLSNLTNIMAGGGGQRKKRSYRLMSSNQADIMSRALKMIGSGKSLFCGGKDITHCIEIALKSFIDASGFDHVREKLAVHNVKLVGAHG